MLKKIPKAVLFDWDGTLVNSWPIIHESMNLTLQALGKATWTIEETTQRVRKSLREAFPPLFGERWQEAREIFYKSYRSVHLEKIEKISGSEELIIELKRQGCQLGVVSNKSGEHLRAESTKLGWNRFFVDHLIGATDASRDKPAIEPVYLALKGTGISPNEDVWFVGDTWVDIACGRASGCITILLGDKYPLDEEFRDHPPHEHFFSCEDFLEVVREI